MQKQALTQIRGAGSFDEQPHIGLGAEHSEVEPHSLWQVQVPDGPGPPQAHR